MNTLALVFLYAAFAIIATLVNLGAQRVVLALDSDWFFLAMLAGTAVGLVTKYVLDKRWIFSDALRPARKEVRLFTLYTITGIGTTLVFWGSETAFWLIWQTHEMREVGAVIGLTVGYVLKFNLDRRFVFRKLVGCAQAGSDRQHDQGDA
ncbi:GtrA family protein [Marimonas arenosa]|uniref:GtrA family protein n=1 Tax=Marimonas arenosa TaxID=1795305 RepID=A0AAE3WGH7_9RHOB|nr:GtrA family protein [Marimonas arenosa]MDQ2092277.1 GtrA family protein [Marimonas arenosa]